MPYEVSEERFEEIVGEAIDLIPDELARHMDNVAILTADEPSPDQARRLRRGTTLLGLYEGVSLDRRSPMSYGAVMPDRIKVAHTVAHEVAHHFGISDARLRELGAY
jgi:predicted Zn-dependent protease with MMP-like domain